ncbi:MAG: hypothetical protein AB1345_10485 [Chloroflexota bacterium]
MGYTDRRDIINRLQKLRGTRIITHINSDRRSAGPWPVPALNTKLGTEAQPFFYETLCAIGRVEALDLFLYTLGGQTDSVWPLVSILREFGSRLSVLIPYKAHSAGTLICLGADTLVMTDLSELSPVDPATGNQFNPVDEINKQTRKAISVEDVASYFRLAKAPYGAGEDTTDEPESVNLDLAFEILAKRVHPLALGNVERSNKQIRELVRRLLSLHWDFEKKGEEEKTLKIARRLTQERYSHTDILNRRESLELLGDEMVNFASEEEQSLMFSLYYDYVDSLAMKKTFVLPSELGQSQQGQLKVVGGFIETDSVSYIFTSVLNVTKRSAFPPGIQVSLQPGQLPPIIPGFPLEIQIELESIGWEPNQKGV